MDDCYKCACWNTFDSRTFKCSLNSVKPQMGPCGDFKLSREAELEEQLAAATARIVDLESENANKRHVDELLFKANARIAELEKARERRFVMPKFEEVER